MPTPGTRFQHALQENSAQFGISLTEKMGARLRLYYELLRKWNPRLHLVAPCSPEEFVTRHVLESLVLLPYVRSGGSIADIGSGGGLPIIPCLIARADLKATMIESSQRKAVFLREALRETGASATVIAERFENVPTVRADYVSSRALESFGEKFSALLRWSPPKSTLLFFAGDALRKQIEAAGLKFEALKIPTSQRRFLFVIER